MGIIDSFKNLGLICQVVIIIVIIVIGYYGYQWCLGRSAAQSFSNPYIGTFEARYPVTMYGLGGLTLRASPY